MKIVSFLFLLSLQANAAIPKNALIQSALRQPTPQRLNLIENAGLSGRLELEKIAFDKQENLESRWRAVTSYGRIYQAKSQSFLEKSLRSPEWFMRNAALLVAPYADRAWAIRWARILIHDQALVVRTAAVQSLRKLNASDSQALLWEKLYSKENFRGGKSLWVRQHILEALAQFASSGQEVNFIGVLNDQDRSLHPIALRALTKITNEKFTTTADWQQWLKKRQI